MRLLSIDYGSKRIGVAVSDPLRITVTPLENIEYTDWPSAISALKAIIESYAPIGKLIVGYPAGLKKNVNFAAENVQKFIEELSQQIRVPVEFWDEKYTSKIASRISGRKKKNDKVAAAVLLEDYLRHKSNG